jgi:hypothetical protein
MKKGEGVEGGNYEETIDILHEELEIDSLRKELDSVQK